MLSISSLKACLKAFLKCCLVLVLYLLLCSSFAHPYHHSYDHGPFHHDISAAHFHMEDRSPAIELHATDDGVHVKTLPASLDIASKLPQSHDHSRYYGRNGYGSDNRRGRYRYGSRGRYRNRVGRKRHRGRKYRNREGEGFEDWQNRRHGIDDRDDDRSDDDDLQKDEDGLWKIKKASDFDNEDFNNEAHNHYGDNNHKEHEQSPLEKVDPNKNPNKPDMSVIAPLRRHPIEPVKYQGESYGESDGHDLVYSENGRPTLPDTMSYVSNDASLMMKSPTDLRGVSPLNFKGNGLTADEMPQPNMVGPGLFPPLNLPGLGTPIGVLSAGFYGGTNQGIPRDPSRPDNMPFGKQTGGNPFMHSPVVASQMQGFNRMSTFHPMHNDDLPNSPYQQGYRRFIGPSMPIFREYEDHLRRPHGSDENDSSEDSSSDSQDDSDDER